MSQANVETVQEVYEAFGRGDVPTILARVSDSTEWAFNAADSSVPWHSTVVGKTALPSFFQALGENVEFQNFQPTAFIDGGDSVIVRLQLDYTVKNTGRTVSEGQVQWWSFDSDGKISGLMHYEDTAQVKAAYVA